MAPHRARDYGRWWPASGNQSIGVTRSKICVVAPSLDIVGGQAVVAQRLIDRLSADADLEITFLPHNPRLPGMLRQLQRIKYVRTIVTFAAYLLSLFRTLPRHDVIHVFSASYWSFLLAPAPALLVGRLLGKRVLLNYRSGEAADHLARWGRLVIPMMRSASAIIVPSGYLVDVFSRFGLVAEPIFNFVDVDALPYRARDPLRPVFLANRNFAPHYNVGCVLRAFRLIQDALPEARLIVAGDGEEREHLHRLAATLELREVVFAGQVTPQRMRELYDAADVYLNSPSIDNMPNSIIEAFAAGLPVVTTNAGGIPYIVTHEMTGLMVESDDHRGLAAATLRLFADHTLARRITVNGREEVTRKYTWPAVHAAWRRAYGVRDEEVVASA
jgi:glycosyltransferase involved in cell wall biosynthesis